MINEGITALQRSSEFSTNSNRTYLTVYQRLLETAERQSKSPIHNRDIVRDTFFFFFFSFARPRNAKRIGACETVRAVIRSFRPKETAASLLPRLYGGSHRQKGISRCTPQRRTLGYAVKQKKKKKKKEKGKRYGERRGRERTFSLKACLVHE